ncbi:hypothetical protein PoB_003220500 [Plakobranchus ocellatus]|uniref:Uncharacterized protein n=1 Tax=Plakobranchus ocellatus TaxID=259542 RepID=A0AAV4AG30_9GAST|nr:hypothetical protein PoB_003220500 [Plakobranchus ocellatus]
MIGSTDAVIISLPENTMGTKVIDKLRIQGKSAPRVTANNNINICRVADENPTYGSPLIHAEPISTGVTKGNRSGRPALVLIPEPGQEVKSKVGPSLVSSCPSSTSSSAASRKQDFLQRVQQANRGLSTADTEIRYSNISPLVAPRPYNSEKSNGSGTESNVTSGYYSQSLPNVQFLLRGKTAPASNIKTEANNNSNGGINHFVSTLHVYLPHQRVGHYKTSAKEVYRARHRPDIQTFCFDRRHASSAYRALRTADKDASYSNTVLGNNVASNSPAYFYLGPPASAPDQIKNTNSTLNRPKVFIPTTTPQANATVSFGLGEMQHRRSRLKDDFSLSGQQFPTPRYHQADYHDDIETHSRNRLVDNFGDYSEVSVPAGSAFIPDIYNRNGGSPTPASGPKRKRGSVPRCGSRESSGAPPVPPCSSATGADPELLQQCLHVHQSHTIGSLAENVAVGASSSESVRLKHFTQYVKKEDAHNRSCNGSNNKTGKINHSKSHNNQRKALFSPSKANRYVFNSVDSYIHFNKIYPRLEQNTNTSTNGSNVRSHIPPIDGFSPHCTETVMLKMIFGMNRPAPSVKSGARYSDIAVHADLDEFVIVGNTTNSISRSTSVASRKLYVSNSSSNNHNNNNNGENINDSSSKKLSSSTLWRSRSNMSNSNEICVLLKEKEEDKNEEDDTDREEKDVNSRYPEFDDDRKSPESKENIKIPNDEGEKCVEEYDEEEAISSEKEETVIDDPIAVLQEESETAEISQDSH